MQVYVYAPVREVKGGECAVWGTEAGGNLCIHIYVYSKKIMNIFFIYIYTYIC
jgi:hypothetical protein